MTPVSTDAVLAGIDATLEAWETQEDAARWHPDGDGPDDLAENQLAEWCRRYADGIMPMTPTLVIYDEVVTAARAVISESIAKMTAAAFGFTWVAGNLHYHPEEAPRRVLVRCRACHPEANPARLAIDGQEYHRRQKARKR